MYSQVRDTAELGVDAHVVCERTENLEQFRVQHIHCLNPDHRRPTFWHTLLSRLRLRTNPRFLARRGRALAPDLIHSHFGNRAWENLRAVRELKTKHVVTFYGYDVSLLPRQSPTWRARYEKLFQEADLFLCEGAHMAACVAALGCPQHKIRIHHLGVAIDQIPFTPRSWNGEGPLRVLLAASFREKKGLPYGLEALAQLARRLPIEVSIIGDAGPSEPEQAEKQLILRILERHRSHLHTRLLGYQRHETLLNEAARHHVFVSPSVTAKDGDTEGGAPVSIIEMLASGMPVVSSMHADIPEVMGEPMAHLLAPERDVPGLVARLEWLVNYRAAWRPLLDAQRERVEREYSRPIQAARLLKLYGSVLKSD
jgi:colanic acid/amylovoran biosynthesis glycosyltransferase